MNDAAIGAAFANANYQAMALFGEHVGIVLASIFLTIGLIGLTPLKLKAEFNFMQVAAVWFRKVILIILAMILIVIIAMYALYVGMNALPPDETSGQFLAWLGRLAKDNMPVVGGTLLGSVLLRFITGRYIVPWASRIWRKWRVEQSKDKLDDIRDQSNSLKAIDYLPQQHYKPNEVFLGLSEPLEPISVSDDIWNETNMQIIGPTRYGKGVLIGVILDQQIRKGRGAVYVDPKGDRFAPHIMYQAARESGRKFIYLDLNDDGPGSWSPFTGGTEREALTRLEMAFSLEYTGDTGTDYYKSQERKALDRAFKQARDVLELQQLMESTESNRINAELSRWSSIKSLCPPKGTGFNMDEAVMENAVIYLKGSLDDAIVKTATTIFIAELIQSGKRLDKSRTVGIDTVIDEVSSLTSRTLALSLATSVGFGIKFVLAYQSQEDLLNIDDTSVSGRYVYQSINVNSQIKAVYGGADHDTAEWVSDRSGTVMKSVPKMERSEINASGGEYWSNMRYLGTEEVNLISINTVLALPPRIAVLIAPAQLAQLCYTAFVPVHSTEELERYLDECLSLEHSADETVEPPVAESKPSRAQVKEVLDKMEGPEQSGATAAELQRRRERKARQKLNKKQGGQSAPASKRKSKGSRNIVGAADGQS